MTKQLRQLSLQNNIFSNYIGLGAEWLATIILHPECEQLAFLGLWG